MLIALMSASSGAVSDANAISNAALFTATAKTERALPYATVVINGVVVDAEAARAAMTLQGRVTRWFVPCSRATGEPLVILCPEYVMRTSGDDVFHTALPPWARTGDHDACERALPPLASHFCNISHLGWSHPGKSAAQHRSSTTLAM
uniref:Uncharacterized protein n=1 Tax=Haptolina brevifila TaxID=156173 RepID=A0A7S2IYK3_9EUKA|mmetsp:Transcript_73764/g.146692  ORF Transcript_73764/g.146692 Transcript_73764/m.146692 type:complete len:148 (+) Transcript_73764:631-1074(+)